ncbi:MAG: SAM-dependent methyltransferase [Anaerolineaceae bacterium]|nr:SAM-dependent methyltransferase [Anaerolineaceae bacterium]
MQTRRIETATSRTAEFTCVYRAASSLEHSACYHSDDVLAPRLLPGLIQPLVRLPWIRRFYSHVIAPRGTYEYVIARTKYIDAVFQDALAAGFDQALIFGAGFDTRALRFPAGQTRIFELDAPATQAAKLGQYRRRGLEVPSGVAFIPIDFERQALPARLVEAGFRRHLKSLFVLEGLTMYLRPEAVELTFRDIHDFAGPGSRVVFDYVYASVLRGEGSIYGREISRTVAGADEHWLFGLEEGAIQPFLARHGLRLLDHKTPAQLEQAYFTDAAGRRLGRVNGAHCLVLAEKA